MSTEAIQLLIIGAWTSACGVALFVFARRYINWWVAQVRAEPPWMQTVHRAMAFGFDPTKWTAFYVVGVRVVAALVAVFGVAIFAAAFGIFGNPSPPTRVPISQPTPESLRAFDQFAVLWLAGLAAIVWFNRVRFRGRVRSDLMYWGGAALFAIGGYFAARFHTGTLAIISYVVALCGGVVYALSIRYAKVSQQER